MSRIASSAPEPCSLSDVWRGLLDALSERLNPQARPVGYRAARKPQRSLRALAAGVVVLAMAMVALAALAAQVVPGLARLVGFVGTQGLANASVALTAVVALGLPSWALWRLVALVKGWCLRGRELRLGLREPWPVARPRPAP